jgi:hypothetical protein
MLNYIWCWSLIQCLRFPMFYYVWGCRGIKLSKIVILYLRVCMMMHMLYYVWCWIFYTICELPILYYILLRMLFYILCDVDDWIHIVSLHIVYLCDVVYLLSMWDYIFYTLCKVDILYLINCVRMHMLYYVEYWIFYTMFEVDYFLLYVKVPILYFVWCWRFTTYVSCIFDICVMLFI